MTTEAMIGHGSEYWIKTAAGSTAGTFPTGYTRVAEVNEINPGESSTDDIDATHMDSPDGIREFVGGLTDLGEGSFGINWVPGNGTDVFIRGLKTSRATHMHVIVAPNGVRVEFPAYVKGFSKAMPMDDKLTAMVTLKIAGAEVWDDTP